MSYEEIANGYSENRGLEWFLEKRLGGMIKLGLIKIKDDEIQIQKPVGLIVGKIVSFTMKLIGFHNFG